jgi:GT2 family glycosyltransferase/predicted SAM-dependent methyltransferase
MLSIIIPVYNMHEMTKDCIEAIRVNTKDYELVIIDNGSEPEFFPPSNFRCVAMTEKNEIKQIHASDFEGYGDIRIIRNPLNLGFPVAVNQGIRAAKGDVIILLNNDVICTPQWADHFLYHLENFSIIGPIANYCAGVQREILPTYNDEKELFQEVEKWSEKHKGESLEVNFIIGFCIAFKKSLYDEIGPFDESLWPCSGEEIDFCLKAREKGYKIGIARDVYVHHIGSVTLEEMDRDGKIKYGELCNRNDEHLAKRWGKDFWLRQLGDFVFNKELENKSIKLNLGCGKYPLEHFINIDQDKNLKPDVVADARNLPFESESIDEIYCGHLLEHFDFEEGQKALKHWRELLKRGGRIQITVPNFDILAKIYLANPTAENMRTMNELYIYAYVLKSHHRYCYGESLLKSAMESAGFNNLEKMPKFHPYYVSPIDEQISYGGIK